MLVSVTKVGFTMECGLWGGTVLKKDEQEERRVGALSYAWALVLFFRMLSVLAGLYNLKIFLT